MTRRSNKTNTISGHHEHPEKVEARPARSIEGVEQALIVLDCNLVISIRSLRDEETLRVVEAHVVVRSPVFGEPLMKELAVALATGGYLFSGHEGAGSLEGSQRVRVPRVMEWVIEEQCSLVLLEDVSLVLVLAEAVRVAVRIAHQISKPPL
eukprot:CAMPEP_0194765962 /NCGR_PEP_ID=MMETSP0323_2-20130528/27454_1 /TAXON_ID=2866 ORGANISM="Crypthecodinium cohnii, Strain Seligo" /NCGR_SAMPLE_ID=MMETSP0323_2 /ASSEMBLY_ACC=CAM_ASM_000346 /LENGTH=151 /DNA_ID=CAMNT_0039696393 /DNA_START=189 /DNA_END=645 /DNA_ORIENTATION=+